MTPPTITAAVMMTATVTIQDGPAAAEPEARVPAEVEAPAAVEPEMEVEPAAAAEAEMEAVPAAAAEPETVEAAVTAEAAEPEMAEAAVTAAAAEPETEAALAAEMWHPDTKERALTEIEILRIKRKMNNEKIEKSINGIDGSMHTGFRVFLFRICIFGTASLFRPLHNGRG